MPRGKGIYDDEGSGDPENRRASETDGDDMVTRETTPDVTPQEEAQEPPD